jgi:hypothetical protein
VSWAGRPGTIGLVTRASIVRVSAAAALLVLGCGGGAGPADAFVGSWTFDSGSIDFGICGGVVLPPIDFTGAVLTITKDDSTDVTATFAATDVSCDIMYTVRPGQGQVKTGQCAISGAATGTFVVDGGLLDFTSTHLVLDLLGGFEPTGTSTSACSVTAVSSALSEKK